MTLTALSSVVVIRASISIVALTCHKKDKQRLISTTLTTVVAHTAQTCNVALCIKYEYYFILANCHN